MRSTPPYTSGTPVITADIGQEELGGRAIGGVNDGVMRAEEGLALSASSPLGEGLGAQLREARARPAAADPP